MMTNNGSISPAQYGPVELNVISLASPSPSPGLLHALAAQIRAGVVRLLDFVVVSKSESGAVKYEEIDVEAYELADLVVHLPGLAGEDDLQALAEGIPAGGAAAVVALELLWARELAEQLAGDGSVVIATERIPAPVVNTIVGMASDD
ncbi:DUF6325 family protein [Microbacterium sp. KUDC0406]|uniref:DUF6325 family protein n=1 Tax=Microbacterium sp. KUDC0406 TaxID=2909588 RepID=UPI001F3E409C|nr:DUF6325 family protein [Microbacterium sp. KUDC0406]UJP11079.1 DUF6325 family protein [Microbacterium sp. KUDC0406]